MADVLSEITRLKYQELARALAQANIGQGIVGESAVWQSLNNGNLTAAQFNDLVSSNAGYNAGFRAIGNADGTIRSYTYVGHDYPMTEFTYDDIIGSFNSNVQSGTSAPSNTFTMQQPTNTAMTGATGSETMKASGGVTKYTNGAASANPILTTMGSVVGAVMAAGTGIQLAKTIDGGLYHIGNALGLDPPDTLNPETWNSITAGDDSAQAGLFNYIFGLNPDNGQLTAYADENAFAYMAGWLYKQGFFSVGGYESRLADTSLLYNPTIWNQPLLSAINSIDYTSAYLTDYNYRRVRTFIGDYPVYVVACLLPNNTKRFTYVSRGSFRFPSTGYNPRGESYDLGTGDSVGPSTTRSGTSFYYWNENLQMSAGDSSSAPYNTLAGMPASSGFVTDIASIILDGVTTENFPVDGVDTQPDGTAPNTSGWDYNDPQNTILPSLQQQYPDLWNNRIENNVVQPDGSVKTYTYIPTQIPSGGNGTNADTQNDKQNTTDPSVDPDDSTDTKLQTIIQILTSLLPQALTDPATVPEDELQDGTNTKNPNPDTPNNPPATGTGNTPTILLPTGSASSLWKVYHPSQAQVDAFGAWLWSSNFVEQIKKMFNDPMQSIIGLHKIFAAPIDAGTATIKVGYLDSQVASAYVDSQYVTVDCGSVSLQEYFGNVFDYEPFTKVAIFLPFIGIQKLDVAEVMRSTISVVYHVDVFSGACLAEVSVTRDGGGGCLYTFSGDASARYPISSGSYMGIVSGVLSIAGGIAGTIATGGAALPAVVGAGVAATHMHTDVKHSGQISGNAGAMGGKVPYLIVVRPQTEVAQRSERYYGYGANSYCKVESLSGFARLYNAVVRPNDSITDEERKEIQTILESGFYA